MGQAETGRPFIPCQTVGAQDVTVLIIRNKEPEYGLYMLNRATVKNPLWPLIPGDMRVTPTNDDVLIVERRGEGEYYGRYSVRSLTTGIKTGIHFGDGKEVVEAFRSSIIGLVATVLERQ